MSTAAATLLAVSERFDSLQGEGSLAGVPTTFIRLAHCNLSCSWCDAAYTWKGNVQFDELPVEQLVAETTHRHVVVTGGEPTLAEGFSQLVAALFAAGHHVTVETNGTIWREVEVPGAVALWSVSPKLGSSGQAAQLDTGVLQRYLNLHAERVQFKFVIDDEADLDAALELLRELGVPGDLHAFVQPNGLCHNAELRDRVSGHVLATDGTARDIDAAGDVTLTTPYSDRLRWLFELVEQRASTGDLPCIVRALPQVHKLAWGNRRGF